MTAFLLVHMFFHKLQRYFERKADCVTRIGCRLRMRNKLGDRINFEIRRAGELFLKIEQQRLMY